MGITARYRPAGLFVLCSWISGMAFMVGIRYTPLTHHMMVAQMDDGTGYEGSIGSDRG